MIKICNTDCIILGRNVKAVTHTPRSPKGPHSYQGGVAVAAFFAPMIALQAIPARTSQRLGRTDDRTLSGVGMARGVAHQGAPEARAKGVICAATVLRRMAVADAESSDLALKLKDGTGKQNGVLVWITPNPCKRLAAA